MKTIVKLLVTAVVVIVGLVAVIKFVQRCSWKEAVGIFEEFVDEMRERCRCCCHSTAEEDETPKEA